MTSTPRSRRSSERRSGDFGRHQEEETVGDYKNNGREWLPKGSPEEVKVHDFIDPEKGKGFPYGVETRVDPGVRMLVGSASGSLMIRRLLRSMLFAAGGRRWVQKPIRRPVD